MTIKELEELIARHETELEEVKKQIVELEGRDPSDVEEQTKALLQIVNYYQKENGISQFYIERK